MKNHALMMLIGCGLPMLLLFILPGFGVSRETTVIIFMVLMMGCHLMHFKHMGHDEHCDDDQTKEGGEHERH